MKIVSMKTRAFWKGEVGIEGQVEDQNQLYQVRLEVKSSYVNSYSCSCTRGNSYKEMCPHEKALFEHYKKQAEEKNRKLVSTSSQARAMIREYTNREVEALNRSQEKGGEPVKFSPVLLLGRQDVRVEFKVGRERFYVIRDLSAFVKAVEQGAYVEYGKQLAFHHDLETFSEECRPLVSLVCQLMELYEECFRQIRGNSFGTAPALRELSLSRGARDHFLKKLSGMELEVEDVRGLKSRLFVREGNPELHIAVKKEGEGLLVSLDREQYSFEGESRLYIIKDQTLYLCDRDFSRDMKVFFEQMTQGYGAPYEVTVSEKDAPLFCQRVLRRLEPYGVLDVENVDLEELRPVELSARFELENPRPGLIKVHPTLSYGDYSFHPVEDDHVPVSVCRDVPGEFRISQTLTRYFPYRDGETNDLVIRDDEEAVYRLLSQGIEELKGLGEVWFSENWESLRILPPPQVTVGVQTAGQWLDLTVDAGDLTGPEVAEILEAYRQRKHYYRLKTGEFFRLEDSGLLTVARLLDGMEISKGELKKTRLNFRVPGYRALYLDELYREKRDIRLERDQRFRSMIREMKALETSDFEAPGEFDRTLRDYQKAGFRWMKTLDVCGFGGILADDMGLGKTIQVLSLLWDAKLRGEQGPLALILCPASLVYNWEWEIRKFAPELRTLFVTGTAQERQEKLRTAASYDVLVTSYDLLKRDLTGYQEFTFRYQIIDEAQYIKNPVTQSSRAVKAIHAVTRFALTGTPVENRLSELWSIFDYLMPGFLYSYKRFKEKFEVPIVKGQDAESLRQLRHMTAPFLLRRLKEDVLQELPEKLETVVYSRMEAEQQKLYSAEAWQLREQLERGGGENKVQLLAQLMRLRQLCCDPGLLYDNYRGGSAKLETCMELVASAVGGGHRILLFSQFTSMLERIGKRLLAEGIPFYTLTGETGKEERIHLVNEFQTGDVPVFLISLRAGGTGLNLTAADMVIHYDPWWNVAVQNQATDRTHRIGQTRQVTVLKLITQGTIEEKIQKLQESKKQLADQVVKEGMVSLGSLSQKELLELL